MAKYCELCNKKIGLFEKKYSLDKYNILCFSCYEDKKRILDEKNRVKKQEEKKRLLEQLRKKRLDEKRKIEEERQQYKNEFIDKFYSLVFVFIPLSTKACMIEKNMIAVNKNYKSDLFQYLIYELYKEIGAKETVKDIDKIIFNENFLKKISSNVLKSTIVNDNGMSINTLDLLKKMVNVIRNTESELCEKALNVMIAGDYYTDIIDNVMLSAASSDRDEFATKYNTVLYLLWDILYVDIFIRAVILSRNIHKFISNDELYKMFTNLKENTKYTIEEISKKLFPIYKQHYTEVFKEKFNEGTFQSLITMIDSYVNLDINVEKLDLLYESEINEFKKDKKFKALLKRIDNKIFFDKFNINYNINSDDINNSYTQLYHYILKKTGKDISSDTFFNFVMDKYNYVEFLKSKQESEEAELERERLLNGDFTKEKKIEIDKLTFDNISNGYEFEYYLKNIFERLDYSVEVTKSSGDQGADLVIMKNGLKTVVQAKYYTNPVGNKAVQEVVGSIAFYNADNGMVVTNSTFTNSAIVLAKSNNITLIDGKELQNMRNAIIQSI